MLDGYISDLDTGDVFRPVEYELTEFMCSEYAHASEENCEWFHSSRAPGGRQVRPPTMIHVDKMRILEANCLKERRVSGEIAPDARIHYEYHAVHHGVAYVGDRLVISGRIVEKYNKRQRTYLWYYLQASTVDGRLITTYNDRTLLKYKIDNGENS
jgi:hypothetical protein